MLEELARRTVAGLVAAVTIAVAAGIALVAASFAMYAGFRGFATPAAASALTAGVFAAIMALIAFVAPRLIKGTAKASRHNGARDADTMRVAMEFGLPILGLIADVALRRQTNGRDRRRNSKHSSK